MLGSYSLDVKLPASWFIQESQIAEWENWWNIYSPDRHIYAKDAAVKFSNMILLSRQRMENRATWDNLPLPLFKMHLI